MKENIKGVLEKLDKAEMIEFLRAISKKLESWDRNLQRVELKKGAKILVGGKYAGVYPFYEVVEGYPQLVLDEYKGIVGEFAYVESDELENWTTDKNTGEDVYAISITLEEDKDKKRKTYYTIHPDDALNIEILK